MPSAQLLLTVLYLIPAVAIIWHTLSERLPTYHNAKRIHNLCNSIADFDFEYKEAICEGKSSYLDFTHTGAFLTSRTLFGFIVSHILWTIKTPILAMSTRYWDEIDWYIQEGTQKLCEMLNKENEDASSSKWSTGEEEDKLTKRNMAEETLKNKDENEIINKFDSISIKEETSDVDSVKDDEEYMERSTSVEDNSVVKKQTKVDELISMCTKCSMLPPIYTYFTTGDEQVVSTVQLWNGVRFSSHAQLTRDKAMEEAAGQAIGYLKNEQRDKRPVSTSPPSTVPYYLPVQNLLPPQYYQTHAAYGTPVSYATTAPQTFFLPSVPYTMIQQPPVVTIPPEYQHAAYLQQYRFDQAAQYSPYHQHYPTVRVQISPSHQQRYHHHSPGAKPVLWTGLQHDPYQVQEKLSSQRKTTEYKLLDKPPSPVDSNQTKESTSEQETLEKTPETSSESEKTTPNKSRPGSAMKKQTAAKPKLAISFNKNQSS